jgi:S1-C subfamily serine protease
MSGGLDRGTRLGYGLAIALICHECSSFVAFSQTGSAPTVSSGSPTLTLEQQKEQQNKAQKEKVRRFLENRSRSITVKILSGDTWGSGILIRRQGDQYLVLTNEHVLPVDKPYKVQTPDGLSYGATLYQKTEFKGNDLALLSFSSASRYTIANLGKSSALRVGNQVFAAGFPLQTKASGGFQFTSGQISLLPTKPFEGGYQIGYSNKVVKGMSGGPLLNSQGIVVGVNGMHAFPLWGDPYVYQDGSSPPVALRKTLINSSWAIPIETFLRLSAKSLQLASSGGGY